jgi:hypothetical protein
LANENYVHLAFVASFAIFGYGLFLLVSDLLFGL